MTRPRRPASATTHRYPRTARLNESLREVIAEELTRIDDERLEFVTVTGIDVDSEMNRAIVYFDSLNGEEGDAAILAALGDHRKRLQGSIGRQVRAKKTPILSFRADEAIRAAARIDRVLADPATMPSRPPDPDLDLDDTDGLDSEDLDDINELDHVDPDDPTARHPATD